MRSAQCSERQRGEKLQQARTNGRSNRDLLGRSQRMSPRLLLMFKVMGIQTSGCEIVGILTKFKDADPADSHRASLDGGTSARRAESRDSGADCCCGGHLHNR